MRAGNLLCDALPLAYAPLTESALSPCRGESGVAMSKMLYDPRY
jgi:hypothetical protein